MKSRAVFFDKDGTLVRDVPYNVNPDLIELNEGAGECLRLLRAAGFKLFVVTNQSGVARGLFSEKDLAAVWTKLDELTGVCFAGFYYCPHYVNGKIPAYSFDCDCRKPKSGLLLQAARQHRIDLKKSWFVGDNVKDAEAGQNAGCRTILLDKTNESEQFLHPDRVLRFTAKNLLEAANLILENLNKDRIASS